MMRDWIPTGMTQKEAVAKATRCGKEMGYIVSRRRRQSGEVHITLRKAESWMQHVWYRFLAVIGR